MSPRRRREVSLARDHNRIIHVQRQAAARSILVALALDIDEAEVGEILVTRNDWR